MSVEYDDLPASSGLDLTSTFLASVAGVKGAETIADLAALLATSGDVAKGLTTVETLSASGTWGDAAIMITDAASTLTLTMPTIPTLAAGQAMRRFLVVLPSTHPVNPVAAGGQTYHGATAITDDGATRVVEMIATDDGGLGWTGIEIATGQRLSDLSAFASALSGTVTTHIADTANPHAVTAAQAGAVPTGRMITATSPLTIDGGASADLSGNRTFAIPAATASVPGHMTAAQVTTQAQLAVGLAQAGYRAVSGNITIDSDDNALLVTANAAITLPAAALNRAVVVKKGTATALTVTIVRAASESIENVAATYTVSSFDSALYAVITLWCDGTNWWIL